MSAGLRHSPASDSGAAFSSSRIPGNCRQAQAYRTFQSLLSSKCMLGSHWPYPCMLTLRMPGSLIYPSPAWSSLPRGMAGLALCQVAAQDFLATEVNVGELDTRSQDMVDAIILPSGFRQASPRLPLCRCPCMAAGKALSEVMSVVTAGHASAL